MIRELLRISDFYDAISPGEGYNVMIDRPTSREIAHPPRCPSLQSEHFREKVVRNRGTTGAYCWVSTMSEARERFSAVPCACG